MNFRCGRAVEAGMFDPEPAELSLTDNDLSGPAEADGPPTAAGVSELDAEAILGATLAGTRLLTAREEADLTRRIVRARRRVRTLLRRYPRLARQALAGAGRGVVHPEDDFREREAVTILDYAHRLLHDAPRRRALGLRLPAIRQFCADLAAALADYRRPRDEMIRANVRLVSALARRYRHPTLSYLDLFQEGTVGLFRAVEKYDPARAVKFSTYATWWIWQQLGRAADTQGALIRTPVHWNQFRRRHARQATGPDTDMAETTDEMDGLDRDRFDQMAYGFRFISTDAPLSDDDDRQLGALLPDETAQPDRQAMFTALRTHLDRAIDSLPPREQHILRQRFGFDTDARTLDEIGQQLGVSRERIRQLENRALARLKTICAEKGLRDYLN
ncbi:sigma-70 family RNA polymerase sigma factor [Candidatus Binatia bacterium]|nr:sigma-70 family RNA polymerase sigma factor [Candidatus Binatia bacterium]